jgi:hypothetical protein
MKKSILLVALAAALACAGCATSGSPLERRTSDDCLVLIRTTVRNPDNAPTVRKYEFSLSVEAPALEASNFQEGYMAVLLREPNVKLVMLKSRIQKGSNIRGDSFDQPLDLDLPYKPGEIVVADFVFAQKLVRDSPNEFTTSYEFVNTSDTDRRSILDRFKKTKAAQSWGD